MASLNRQINMRIVIVFVVLMVVNGQDDDGKGASARSTDVSVGCFASDSTVRLSNGEEKNIGALRTGDGVLAVEQDKVTASEMFLMLDKETSKTATFYTFRMASDHRISLTGLHLIPIVSSGDQVKYTSARDIQLGERFYVLINGELQPSPVVNITIETKQGYFAPLTLAGTLLVNDVYASCFASVRNHQFAQTFMAPFRWYYRLAKLVSFSEPLADHRSNGIHWLLEPIYDFVSFIQPSSLQRS